MHNKLTFKKIAPYLVIIIFVIILIFVLVDNMQSVDPNSDEIKEIYSYFGNDNLEYCDGLIYYDGDVNVDNLDNTKKLCLAFKLIEEDNYTTQTLKKYKKNSYCLSGSNEFKTDEEKGTCDVFSFDANTLNEKYYTLFGSNIENNENFEISGLKICYYDEENSKYTCGDNTTQTIEIGWNPYIYRLLSKAKKVGDKIILTDYYLAVNNSTCYLDNEGNSQNDKCSQIISSLEVDSSTVKKYGKKYIHTFVLKEDGKYHWYSSIEAK